MSETKPKHNCLFCERELVWDSEAKGWVDAYGSKQCPKTHIGHSALRHKDEGQ